jgi:hypothetical protein
VTIVFDANPHKDCGLVSVREILLHMSGVHDLAHYSTSSHNLFLDDLGTLPVDLLNDLHVLSVLFVLLIVYKFLFYLLKVILVFDELLF